MFGNLRGKKVLVTGASSGIGACTARLFAREGALVGIHHHTGETGARTVLKEIQERGGEGLLLKADLLDPPQREGLVGRFIDRTGGIDILINNAGGPLGREHFLDLPVSSWEGTLSLNLTAPFILAREAFRWMKDHGGGRIVNISSIAALYGGSVTSLPYGAAKSGLEAVTRSLARAGAPHNILVNTIQPGVIDTPAHRKMGRRSLEERARTIPLGHPGTPRDVAGLCLFLASDGGDYITGQTFRVTGGE
ncbi:MAG: SDR family oxidoreductase [Methanomicrobiales archaeon]|nr:SDR family oxidoreductase [Methanomicrobiales archaeon]